MHTMNGWMDNKCTEEFDKGLLISILIIHFIKQL